MQLKFFLCAMLSCNILIMSMGTPKQQFSRFEELLRAALIDLPEGPFQDISVELRFKIIEFLTHGLVGVPITLDVLVNDIKSARLVNVEWKNIIDAPDLAQKLTVAIHETLPEYSPTFIALYMATPGTLSALMKNLATDDRQTLISEGVQDIIKSALGRYQKAIRENQAIAMLNALVKLGVTKKEFEDVFNSTEFKAENMSTRHGYATQLVTSKK